MRRTCHGLLLLIATMAGCANLDAGGYGENYNGLPWGWLMRKPPTKSRTDALIQHPEYSPAGRFAKPEIGSTTAVGTTEMLEEAPPKAERSTPTE